MGGAQTALTIRNFQQQTDIPRMIQIRIAIEQADQLGDDTSEASLLAQFNWPGHDPALDRWVVEAGGTDGFVGYAWTFAQSPRRSIIHIGVHPTWRRRGIGSQLLEQVNRRAKGKGAVEIVAGARAKSIAGHAFLQARAFLPVGTNRFFTAPADTSVDPPIWPQGFVVKSLAELGDLTAVVAGSNGCYTDMWGHRENTEPLTVAHLQENMQKFPTSYDPAGIFVLFAPDGTVAGLSFSRYEQENGSRVIDSPGVVPLYRHLALQRPLVQTSMRWLDQQAPGETDLYTFGDFVEAVEIYEALGFMLTPEQQLTEYLLT